MVAGLLLLFSFLSIYILNRFTNVGYRSLLWSSVISFVISYVAILISYTLYTLYSNEYAINSILTLYNPVPYFYIFFWMTIVLCGLYLVVQEYVATKIVGLLLFAAVFLAIHVFTMAYVVPIAILLSIPIAAIIQRRINIDKKISKYMLYSIIAMMSVALSEIHATHYSVFSPETEVNTTVERVAAGFPLPMIYDGFATSPVGSVNFFLAITGDDEMIWLNFVIDYIFWYIVVYLIEKIYTKVRSGTGIGRKTRF